MYASRPTLDDGNSRDVRTLRPRSTLARMGLRWKSNASSVTEKLVIATGATRDAFQTSNVSGRFAGLTWYSPAAAMSSSFLDASVGGYIASSRAARAA